MLLPIPPSCVSSTAAQELVREETKVTVAAQAEAKAKEVVEVVGAVAAAKQVCSMCSGLRVTCRHCPVAQPDALKPPFVGGSSGSLVPHHCCRKWRP